MRSAGPSVILASIIPTVILRCAFLILLLSVSLPALATLGGDAASVRNDSAQVKGTLQIRQEIAYSVYEISAPGNTHIREYLSGEGKVFGVSWQGAFVPDLQQLLGPYFKKYSDEVQAEKAKYVGRRPLHIHGPELVIETSGHMRSYNGRVYDPQLVPASVTEEEIAYGAPAGVTSDKSAIATEASISTPSATSPTTVPPSTASNVQSISVNGGPVHGVIYPNGAFTSVMLCERGTSTCKTVNGILVDTGSYGLRVLRSALSGIDLKPIRSKGNTLNECVSFLNGSFVWGTVALADVKIAGEAAHGVPVQVVADPKFEIPASCSNGGTDEDNQAALGANGILGIGPEPFDCGLPCASGVVPPVPAYYFCSSSGACAPTFVSCGAECNDRAPNHQVTNPIILFPTDNNGVILHFPTVSHEAAPRFNGSMIFGINTRSNNRVGKATVFTLNSSDNFTTTFEGQTLTSSFIDSGSNAYFFPSAIKTCSDLTSFYCPPSIQHLSATNKGATQGDDTVNFRIDNADNLFKNNPNDAVFTTLGGPQGTPDTCSNGNGSCTFEWGLPFFYGRSVFTAIDGQTVSGQPPTPWWAY
jgi:Protein of unknown function (DUF3443)/Protein of unknown function (DUF2844)